LLDSKNGSFVSTIHLMSLLTLYYNVGFYGGFKTGALQYSLHPKEKEAKRYVIIFFQLKIFFKIILESSKPTLTNRHPNDRDVLIIASQK